MRDWIFKPNRRGRLIDWMAVDSQIDSSLYRSWAQAKDGWAAYSNFFARFRVTGFRRWVLEFGSETVTLGIAGLLVVLAFALPSIDETRNSAWRTASEFSVTFLDRYGNEIGKRGILHSDGVPLEELPPALIKATLATEDRRFYEHFGIDVLGTFRAVAANAQANDVVQGGSSLTQQLAKNLFLSSERSIVRKVKELFIAFWLESHLTKDEILKMYLDRSYMGGGAFGVEAASQLYFGKSVRDITLAESVVLAGLFKAPTKYAPHANLAESRARANQVLTNMVDAGMMTEGQVHGARLNPAAIIERKDFYAPNYYLDWAFEEVQRLMKDRPERTLIARTTVDVGLQKAAEEAVETQLAEKGKSMRADQAALVSMELDGAVRAMVGGRDYGDSQFNRATHAYRQPGSSFKSYVYLTALENGFKPTSMVVDGGVACGNWSPKNYDGGYRGRMNLADALARSVNTIAVKLSLDNRIGRDKVLINLKKIGLSSVKKTCSMALGDQGITVLDHTSGYAVFASGGKAVHGYAVAEIVDPRGDVLYSREREETPPQQIFERGTVEMLNSMLEGVVTRGTGKNAALDFTSVAGKTGTSSEYRDAWFLGFTGQYVTGVWYGNDSFKPTNKVTGGSLPGMTWKAYMTVASSSPAIPPIPGVTPHPRQQEELDRIASLPVQTTTTTVETQQNRVRDPARLPVATRDLIDAVGRQFREAPQVGETSSLDQPPAASSVTR